MRLEEFGQLTGEAGIAERHPPIAQDEHRVLLIERESRRCDSPHVCHADDHPDRRSRHGRGDHRRAIVEQADAHRDRRRVDDCHR